MLSLSLSAVFAAGCAAKYVVKSDPEGVAVYYQAARSDNRIKLGDTPFELTEEQFTKTVSIDPHSVEYFELVFERQGFRPERLLVPGARFGAMSTTVSVAMKPSANDGNIARDLLQMIMNAQKFANEGDFQRAHSEVDRALQVDAKFARAASMKGAIYFMEKNYGDSLKWYESALQIDSQQQDVVKMISHLRRRLGMEGVR